MARRAQSAFSLKRRVRVLPRRHIVEWTNKQLVSRPRSQEVERKHAWRVGKRQASSGIDSDPPDLVAEIAADPFRPELTGRGRIGAVRRLDCSHWHVARGAVAGGVGEVESVTGAEVGIFRVWPDRRRPILATHAVTRDRALIPIEVGAEVHAQKARVGAAPRMSIPAPLVYGQVECEVGTRTAVTVSAATSLILAC